jgi:ABC-type protease/lipase transport system fused ATPase/permease subunit
MFTGTIRSNLDPFESVQDDQIIWDALKAVHLHKKVLEMPDKLDTPITENGKIFNISERQLFCIARALLIKTKIVIFDEPTHAVDQDTAKVVQVVMKENFLDATVIVLASQFDIIVQMDKVMVLEHGKIVEFDTPFELLENPKSELSKQLAKADDVDPVRLRTIARTRTGSRRSARSSVSQDSDIGSSRPSTYAQRQTSHGSGMPSSLNDLFSELSDGRTREPRMH